MYVYEHTYIYICRHVRILLRPLIDMMQDIHTYVLGEVEPRAKAKRNASERRLLHTHPRRTTLPHLVQYQEVDEEEELEAGRKLKIEKNP